MTIATLVAGAPIGVGTVNHDATKAVQAKLGLSQTGVYDQATAAVVEGCQRAHGLGAYGLTAWGQVGAMTARMLDALPAVMSAGSPAPQVTVQARSNFGAAPIWFQWALHEVGVHEVGDNAGPDVRRFIADAHVGAEGMPWCAIFANAAFEVNGIPGTRSASSQSFRDHPNFVPLAGPALGAVAVFWRQSHSSGLGHVGFYRGEAGDRVYVLGGNEADQVQIEGLPKAASSFGLRDYWWPKSVPLPVIGAVPIRTGQPLVQVKVV